MPGQPPLQLETIKLDRRQQVATQVFDHLRAQILSLRIEPSTPLSRLDLSKIFGVSQTPIRDALQRLEHEGLVIVYPQSSTLVAPIDLEQAWETLFLRTALEIEVAQTIADNPQHHDLTTLDRLTNEMQHIWENDRDYLAFRAKDQAFHAALFQSVGRENLWDYVVQRSGNIDRLRSLHLPTAGKATKIIADHRQIIIALQAGNLDAAQIAIRDHLSGTLNAAQQIKADHPDYFEA